MLARDHALSGAVVFTAAAPLLHVTGPTLLAGAVFTAGRHAAGHRRARLDGVPHVRLPDRRFRLAGAQDQRRHRKGTHGGCPLAWPVSRHDFHLLPGPLRITTGRFAEHWIVSVLLTAALGYLLWRDTGMRALLHHVRRA